MTIGLYTAVLDCVGDQLCADRQTVGHDNVQTLVGTDRLKGLNTVMGDGPERKTRKERKKKTNTQTKTTTTTDTLVLHCYDI
jgi:hypothetical protein